MLSKNRTRFEVLADIIANIVGSWQFLIIQTLVIILWILFNTLDFGTPKWDPYPFIFLNLSLSFQAAYTAPIIMMSQNRQNQLDRDRAEQDYEIDRKAERKIEEIQKTLSEIQKEIKKLSKN